MESCRVLSDPRWVKCNCFYGGKVIRVLSRIQDILIGIELSLHDDSAFNNAMSSLGYLAVYFATGTGVDEGLQRDVVYDRKDLLGFVIAGKGGIIGQ